MSDYPDDLLKEARKICSAWLHVDGPYRDALGLVVQGMMAERERCAGIADEWNEAKHISGDMAAGVFPKRSRVENAIAAAIRKGTA